MIKHSFIYTGTVIHKRFKPKIHTFNYRVFSLLLDLSDPRTVDEGITALPGIKLLFRDQIAEIYEENVKARSGIVPAVEKIIDKEIPIIEATMRQIRIII